MSSKLGEILVRKGFISEGQLSDALARQSYEGGLLGSVLVEMGFADEDQIRRVLTRKYGGVSIGLSDVDIDPELAGLISEETARRYSVVPVARARGRIAVAMSDPTNVVVADELQFLTGYVIEPMMASESELRQKIDAFYSAAPGARSVALQVSGEADARVRHAAALTDSAKSLVAEKRYEEAATMFQQAEVAYAEVLGPEHLDVAKARSRLGHAYTLQEDYDAAADALSRALELMEAWFGDDHIEMAKTLNNLGIVHHQQQRYSEARSFYERALALERDALSAKNPETGITVLNLAHTYNRQQRFEDAERWFALAVELLSAASSPPEHRALANARASLGACRWTLRAMKASRENSVPRGRDV